MKTKLLLPALLAALSVSLIGCGEKADDHDHDHDHEHADHDHDHDGHEHAEGEHKGETEKKAGPNGGRVISTVEPAVEFLVTDDRKIKLTFLDAELKPVAAAAQVATVIAGDRAAPVKLNFVREGDALVSDGQLPEGSNYPTVVQIKVSDDASPVIEKFNLDLSSCPTCEYKEYACVCDH